jgi:sugar/nucleoside kinase (ribokinase family)
VVGSVAFDSVETPFGKADNVLGGAASFFSLAASLYTKVKMVGTVGNDFPDEYLDLFRSRGIDLEGLQRQADGQTFRWVGDYGYDLNVAHTIDTQLNVFATFQPKLPESYRDARYVYLANILPALQLQVLDQVRAPEFVGLDSMNFWIGDPEHRKTLAQVVKRVNAVFMNDAEIRQYTDTYNLLQAARQVLSEGPRVVFVKRGESGAMAVASEGVFVASAFPLESPKDPTGAGDTFAGGVMGYLARTDDVTWSSIKRAVAYGSVTASFAVEDFSVRGLLDVSLERIVARYDQLQALTALEAQELGSLR